MSTRHTACALTLLAVTASDSSLSAEQPRPSIVPIHAMTQHAEVLHGDPKAVGQAFVIRIRELPGGVIPPHRHPVDEHITVVQGTLYFGVGEKFESAAMQELKTGGYAFIPKGTTMFGYTPEAAIVQVHGIGPFHIQWRAGSQWRDRLRTLDDADAAKTFRFRKGEGVIAGRGKGRILQGYDSGEFIGYDIEGADGTLFMAEEKDLRRVEASAR